MYVKEFILLCYIISIAASAAGITCCVLSYMRSKTPFGKQMLLFMTGLLVMCFYDMAIYYCNYVIGILSSMEVMRIGSCIIAGNICLWILVQRQVLHRDSLKSLDATVLKYLVAYGGVWLILTLALSVEQFYTVKWLLLATDMLLIIAFLTVCIARIVYASVAGERETVYYFSLITGLILWNYISYFWSEASVYWGNSAFIRAPMDLTIVIWLVINALNTVYAYRHIFQPAFAKEAAEETETPAAPAKDLQQRIDEMQQQYKLTPREKEFVELIYRGKTNREIAEMLFLSESTVKTHIYNIFRKLNVKSRVGVICLLNGEADELEPQPQNG